MAAWIAVAGVAVITIACVPIFAVAIRRRRARELPLQLLAGEALSESSLRLVASATCAAIVGEISAKTLPRFVHELTPPLPDPAATRSKDDRRGLARAHGQVLDLLQAAAALKILTGRFSPQETGSEAAEQGVFEELIRLAGPPPEVSVGAADVYSMMVGSVSSGASRGTRELATWVFHELDSPARAEISLEAPAADLGQVGTEDGWAPVLAAEFFIAAQGR